LNTCTSACPSPLPLPHAHRKEDVEAKYYADGEDAYAMKRSLTGLAEQIEKEKEAQKRQLINSQAGNKSSTDT